MNDNVGFPFPCKVIKEVSSEDDDDITCIHVLDLLEDGTVFACGRNEWGQLGFGDRHLRFTPTKIPNMHNVRDIACGEDYSIFTLKDNTVYGCGCNRWCQLGIDNDDDDIYEPTKIPISNVKKVACGNSHTMFLLTNDTLFGCGYNASGQLGLASTIDNWNSIVHIPVQNVRDVACGDHFSMVVLNDGTVYSCGGNVYGALGLTDSYDRYELTKIDIPKVRSVHCIKEDRITLFELENGDLYICGDNEKYQSPRLFAKGEPRKPSNNLDDGTKAIVDQLVEKSMTNDFRCNMPPDPLPKPMSWLDKIKMINFIKRIV